MLIASAVVIGMIHLERLRFDIPAGRAAQTINLWSRQADVQVLYDWSTLSTRPTPAVRCLCTPARALSLLLGPLALTFQWVNPKTIDVTRIPMCAPNADEPPPPPCFAGTIL